MTPTIKPDAQEVTLPPLPSQYSVDIRRSDGHRTLVFADGGKQRIEVYQRDGRKMVNIARPDLGLIWTIASDAGHAVQRPLASEEMSRVAQPDDAYRWFLDGSETVDGKQFTRVAGQFREVNDGSIQQTYLLDMETGLRRRCITYDRAGQPRLRVEFECATLGPQPSSLFELPEGTVVDKL